MKCVYENLGWNATCSSWCFSIVLPGTCRKYTFFYLYWPKCISGRILAQVLKFWGQFSLGVLYLPLAASGHASIPWKNCEEKCLQRTVRLQYWFSYWYFLTPTLLGLKADLVLHSKWPWVSIKREGITDYPAWTMIMFVCSSFYYFVSTISLQSKPEKIWKR